MSYSEKVVQAIQEEHLEDMENYLNQAIESDTLNDLYLLSDSLYQLGFLNETERILKYLLAKNPSDDELKINLAEIAIEEGKDIQAIEWLQEVEKSSAAYPQALLVSADYYQSQDLPEVSEQKLLEAKELLPEEPIITFALAELYFTMGKYAQAIRNYEKLLTNGEEEIAGIQLVGRLGSAYSALGDWENATGYLEEALERKEDIDIIFQLGFTYFQQKEFQRANELFFQVNSIDHTYTSVYPYLAKGLEEEQELEKAAGIINEGIIQDKTNYQLYLIGASIELKRRNDERAEEYYKHAMELDPDNETITIQYTNFLIHQERFEETVEIIQSSLNELDADPQFYWNLAISQLELEEYEAASRAFEKSYPHFDTDPNFLKQYFLFLQEEGQNQKMSEVGEKYLEIQPNDPEVQEFLKRQDDDWV